MKGICCEIIPILGSSAGYREKQSYNRMVDSHLSETHIALKCF